MTGWTESDEKAFLQLRDELRRDTAAKLHGESEEDAIKAERMRRMLARRRWVIA